MWNLKPYQGTFGICYMKSHVSRYLTHPQFRGMMPRGSWKILLHWVIQTFWNVDLFSYMTSKKKNHVEFISPLLSAENHWSIGTLSRSWWWKPMVWNPVSSESLGLSFGKHTVSCFSWSNRLASLLLRTMCPRHPHLHDLCLSAVSKNNPPWAKKALSAPHSITRCFSLRQLLYCSM